MPRKRRPLDRKTATRDAKLIIIATEDSKASVKYFQEFSSPKYYQNSKAQVKVIPRESTNSSPEHIFLLLEEFCQEFQLDQNDELWLILDTDRWGDKKLSEICALASQKNFKLAISNPSIELWFLLHLKPLHNLSESEKTLFLENKKITANRTKLDKEIIKELGEYNKSNLNIAHFLPNIHFAIQNSKELEKNIDDRWPQTLGTRVYLLAESILNSAPYSNNTL